jgi:hypothetical protein
MAARAKTAVATIGHAFCLAELQLQTALADLIAVASTRP